MKWYNSLWLYHFASCKKLKGRRKPRQEFSMASKELHCYQIWSIELNLVYWICPLAKHLSAWYWIKLKLSANQRASFHSCITSDYIDESPKIMVLKLKLKAMLTSCANELIEIQNDIWNIWFLWPLRCTFVAIFSNFYKRIWSNFMLIFGWVHVSK